MKKQITISAKSLEDALALASVELGVAADEIHCEVVTEPKKGFLGLGSVPGEYKCVYGKDNADKAIGFLTNILNNMGLENARAVYDTELMRRRTSFPSPSTATATTSELLSVTTAKLLILFSTLQVLPLTAETRARKDSTPRLLSI